MTLDKDGHPNWSKPSFWTYEKTKSLINLRKRGVILSEIAKELKTTKSAVAGKLSRIKYNEQLKGNSDGA